MKIDDNQLQLQKNHGPQTDNRKETDRIEIDIIRNTQTFWAIPY